MTERDEVGAICLKFMKIVNKHDSVLAIESLAMIAAFLVVTETGAEAGGTQYKRHFDDYVRDFENDRVSIAKEVAKSEGSTKEKGRAIAAESTKGKGRKP